MTMKTGLYMLVATVAVLGSPTQASAQRASGLGTNSVPQTINFTLGAFVPRGEDARVDDDVLNVNREFLLFDVADFKSATLGVEWLFPLHNYIEAGAGISVAQRTVPSLYAEFVDTNGGEIEQEIKIRQVPIAFTIRALPLGAQNPIQPYFGAGINVVAFKYSESGDFIDFNDNQRVFTETYEESGAKVAPVVLAGIRFAGEAFSVGGEVRWQKADADLPTDFAGSKLDLGGLTYQFTFGIRFD